MVETNFKHTEIGLIPHDWEVATLGELVNVHDGTHQTPHYVNVGVNFYSVENITNNEFSKTKFISEEEHALLTRKFKIERGDVLMTRIGSIGVCKYIDWDVRASFYVSLALLKNKDKDRLYMPFLAFASTTKEFKDSVSQNSLQFAIPLKINLGKISDITFPLPPTTAEQERIAGALSSIDTLIGALNEQIEKKRHIKQGTMQQLLTGKKRLTGFTGEWKTCKIKDIVGSVKRGQGLQSKDYVKGNIPVVAGGKQYAGFHNVANHFGCTITVSGSGANAGYVALHTTPIFATDCSVIDEKDDFILAFIYFVLLNKQSEIYKLQSGGAQPHIYPKNIEDIIVSIPPTIAEQRAIAAVLSGMDTEIAALEQKRDKYIAIKSGMMQDLLTGKIRLV